MDRYLHEQAVIISCIAANLAEDTSANDLIDKLGLNSSVVFNIINELTNEKIILRNKDMKTEGTSKFATYGINPDYAKKYM